MSVFEPYHDGIEAGRSSASRHRTECQATPPVRRRALLAEHLVRFRQSGAQRSVRAEIDRWCSRTRVATDTAEALWLAGFRAGWRLVAEGAPLPAEARLYA